jgi:DeoR family galactitol utilization operon repressor
MERETKGRIPADPAAGGHSERRVMDLLLADPAITVTKLAKTLGVSTVSTRKVLNGLAAKGQIIRARGGAMPAFHPGILSRQRHNLEQKQRIAQAAAKLVHDGDTIMIEAGTTTALVARYLLGTRDVHVVTNSALVLPHARVSPALHLTVVGGEFRPATESFVGSIALGDLEGLHVRLAFVGTDGFSPEGGLTTHLVEGAEIVRKMAAQSERTVLVADSTKWGRRGFVRVLPLARVHTVISDRGLGRDAVRTLEKARIQVCLV